MAMRAIGSRLLVPSLESIGRAPVIRVVSRSWSSLRGPPISVATHSSASRDRALPRIPVRFMSARKRDPYDVLGINRSASADEIKKAYRKMALKHHPDTNSDNPKAKEQFAEVNEAYQILKDENKKRMYDSHGHAGVDASEGAGGGDPFGGFRQGGFGGGGGGFGGNSDFFRDIEDMFRQANAGRGGGGPRRRVPTKGEDTQATLTLQFEEAIWGCDKEMKVSIASQCAMCEGSGCAPGTSPTVCSRCGGQGAEIRSEGFFQVQSTCRACGGEGQTIPKPCTVCRGNGAVNTQNTVKVKVPAGVETGMSLRLNGQGSHGKLGGPPGDVIVRLAVRPHPVLQRQGETILSQVDVGIAQAILGGPLDVATIDGTATVKVPPGTQTGDKYALRGKGAPRLQRASHRGDHNITWRVKVPRPGSLTPRQRELVEELQQIQNDIDNPPKKPSDTQGDEKGTAKENDGASSPEKQTASEKSSAGKKEKKEKKDKGGFFSKWRESKKKNEQD